MIKVAKLVISKTELSYKLTFSRLDHHAMTIILNIRFLKTPYKLYLIIYSNISVDIVFAHPV